MSARELADLIARQMQIWEGHRGIPAIEDTACALAKALGLPKADREDFLRRCHLRQWTV